jgi:hypothetical protein
MLKDLVQKMPQKMSQKMYADLFVYSGVAFKSLPTGKL